MEKARIYLKLEKDVELLEEDIYMKDLGKILCKDEQIVNKCKTIKVVKFRKNEFSRKVISVLRIIELIEQEFPHIEVSNVGETDVIVERVKTKQVNKCKEYFSIVLVSCISFFGTAFTIMAFHHDSGVGEIFETIYNKMVGTSSGPYNILEISYSIGLAVGIIVFFNHVGNRRITKDPTPIEVEMRNYEREVNDALIETADREGITIDIS